MNPQAIISAIPMLRRLWKFLPPPLRIPVLLIAAAIGVWQFLSGRKAGQARGGQDATGPSAGNAGATDPTTGG